MAIFKAAIVLFAIFAIVSIAWRWASDRHSLPCPSSLAWLLDNPILQRLNGTETTLDRLRLKPGEQILEIGPGPGRLLIPAAQRILPAGQAWGIDIQSAMVDRLNSKAEGANVSNLTMIVGDAAAKHVPDGAFDLVFLCTALGEIPDRTSAMQRCFDALKPGGRLSVTEMFGDPHYQRLSNVKLLAENVGLTFQSSEGSWWFYTATFTKPARASTLILRGVTWCFSGERFSDRAAFDAAVRNEQFEGQKEAWRPDEIAIAVPRIQMIYLCWHGDEQLEPVVELVASNGQFFTAGDLLFQIHNAVVEQLRDDDHKFFEGLSLYHGQTVAGLPLYSLNQGS